MLYIEVILVKKKTSEAMYANRKPLSKSIWDVGGLNHTYIIAWYILFLTEILYVWVHLTIHIGHVLINSFHDKHTAAMNLVQKKEGKWGYNCMHAVTEKMKNNLQIFHRNSVQRGNAKAHSWQRIGFVSAPTEASKLAWTVLHKSGHVLHRIDKVKLRWAHISKFNIRI